MKKLLLSILALSVWACKDVTSPPEPNPCSKVWSDSTKAYNQKGEFIGYVQWKHIPYGCEER